MESLCTHNWLSTLPGLLILLSSVMTQFAFQMRHSQGDSRSNRWGLTMGAAENTRARVLSGDPRARPSGLTAFCPTAVMDLHEFMLMLMLL